MVNSPTPKWYQNGFDNHSCLSWDPPQVKCKHSSWGWRQCAQGFDSPGPGSTECDLTQLYPDLPISHLGGRRSSTGWTSAAFRSLGSKIIARSQESRARITCTNLGRQSLMPSATHSGHIPKLWRGGPCGLPVPLTHRLRVMCAFWATLAPLVKKSSKK